MQRAAAGVLLINKPAGPTSHDIVEVVRRKLSLRRVGHTGTLDPVAEGLLVLLIGAATKYQHALQAHEKTYEATVRFGLQTDTGDAVGAPIRRAPVPPMDADRVAAVLASFRGPVVQTPPAYSAVKVKGRPAYWWARRRQPVVLPQRVIQVYELTLLRCEPDAIRVRTRCSAGAYIRTLAETIAERLGTVGHLASLTRLQVGPWTLDQARTLPWVSSASPETVAACLLPVHAESHACPPRT